MTLVVTDKTKDTLKKYKELLSKIKDLIRSITNRLHNSKLNNSDNYDEKNMKIISDYDDALALKKTLELYNIVIVVRSVSLEGNKYSSQVFLDECLFKL